MSETKASANQTRDPSEGSNNPDVNEITPLLKRRASTRLSPEQVKKKNEKLIRSLRALSGAMQIETKDLAAILEIDYSQLNACYTGFRDFAYLSPRQRMNIARFLGVPGLQVALWCGLITLEELVSPQDAETKTNHVYYMDVVKNPAVALMAPSDEEWNKASDQMKLAYVLLYQAYTQKWLMRRVRVDEKAMEQAVSDSKIHSGSVNEVHQTRLNSPANLTAEQHFVATVPSEKREKKKSGFTVSPVINEKVQSREEAVAELKRMTQELDSPPKPLNSVLFTPEQVEAHQRVIAQITEAVR